MLAQALFAGIADQTQARLDREVSVRQIAAGQSLFHRGDEADELFAVDRGRFKVWRASEDGQSLTLLFVEPGHVVGTVALAQRRPHVVSATAMVDATVRSWRASLVRELFGRDPVLAMHVAELLAGSAANLAERMDEFASGSIDQRIARTLARLAAELGIDGSGRALEVVLSRRDLADLTHSTMPTVSRVMSRWREAGIVDGGRRGRIQILKLEELCAIGGIDY